MGDFRKFATDFAFMEMERNEYKRQLAEMRDVLRALTEADDAGLVYAEFRGKDLFVCGHCGNHAVSDVGFEHTPDCPITRGRAALVKDEAR